MARRTSKGTQGLGRDRTPRPKGIPICHDCRKDRKGPGIRVPVEGIIGAHWLVCPDCAYENGRSQR